MIVTAIYKYCTSGGGGGGGGGLTYIRDEVVNTFAFLDQVHRLVLCHLHVCFQVKFMFNKIV